MNCAVATATLLYYFVACHCLLAFATATFSSPFTSIFHNDVAQSAKDVPHNTSGHRWLSKWRWKWTQDTPVTAYGKQFDENEEESIDEAKITTVEIIASRGYPVEIHEVITEDGYILELHRIPYGKGQVSKRDVEKQVVFIQHGFLNTDNVWIITPNNQGLAYILADTGVYDVWLGNARGNTYSRKHVYLDPSEEDYWNFSFDEMGKYDIPAVINYVLAKTGRNTMSYIGHSMGCAMFFIGMSLRPELNAKIDVMIGLAPASSVAESQTGLRFQAPFVNLLVNLFRILGVRIYEPVDSTRNNFRKRFCGPSLFLRYSLCQNPIFATTSDEYRDIDVNLLPVIDGHNPAGTSVRTAAHFAQNFNAGQTFQRYDFGPTENQLRYGQATPPAYDLSQVTCPVFLFWGQSDKVVDPRVYSHFSSPSTSTD
ncbi:lipase member K-like [Daphnia pulicaria]|uniref:lipase member K-like n=1 Tax=Daphnia pulicaria TaxID=35523 RepID=UPI001EECE641|nr:lipase member K-like [Daphnia pulicaria]